MFEHRIQNREQFAHAGREDHLLGFAGGPQAEERRFRERLASLSDGTVKT